MTPETWHTVYLKSYQGKPLRVRVQFEPRRGDLIETDGATYEVTGRTLRADGTAVYRVLRAREETG